MSKCFKPHQRGGGCCSYIERVKSLIAEIEFQTPSAGRWVLQRCQELAPAASDRQFQTPSAGRWVLQRVSRPMWPFAATRFKPHQRGGGCCSQTPETLRFLFNVSAKFQTPSAGRWVLQLVEAKARMAARYAFQTPSAGRWALQQTQWWASPSLSPCFKPHQRGGGCCSPP